MTTNKAKNERASLWIVKEAFREAVCEIGKPIKCGETVRLQHVETSKNLHSHLFRAPLSGNQEVSAFGDNGEGDTGDNWQIVCDSNKETYWQRYKPVSFLHVDTKKMLSTADGFKFNHQNCGGNCPIMDQTEVSASPRKDVSTKWFSDQGVYFPMKSDKHEIDDEL